LTIAAASVLPAFQAVTQAKQSKKNTGSMQKESTKLARMRRVPSTIVRRRRTDTDAAGIIHHSER
jgi:hypothetical protein